MAKTKAAVTRVDVCVELIRRGSEFSLWYQFRDWESGNRIDAHEDGLSSQEARKRIDRAIPLWGLRKVRGANQWRNTSSLGFRRAVERVRGRARRIKEQELNE